MSDVAEVAIIGAGPVGLLLGNLLGRRGVSALILDRQPAAYDLPRAVHFDGEAMRVFQSAGLAEEILPLVMVGRGMVFKNAEGRVLVDWSRDQAPGRTGWHESYRFHQPDLERVLERGLERFPGVRLARGRGVIGVAEDEEGVWLTMAEGGPIRARYVVGCDGAESFLRKALGIGQEDLGFRERWLVADVALGRARPDLGDFTIQHCDAEAPVTYVRGAGHRRRWEMRLDPDENPPLDEPSIWRRIGRWIGPEDGMLERIAVYEFASAIAREWRRGRAFLAGDAAHQMPPFMGQGLCAGVRDAAALSWRLAVAIRQGAVTALDSYADERKENVRAFIDLSVRLGRLINQTAAGEAPQGRMRSIWPALGPGLGPRAGVAGTLAPQARLSDGRRSDDASRGSFHVLARGRCPAPTPVYVVADQWLSAHDLFAAIIRPDGYVLDTARDRAELADRFDAYPRAFWETGFTVH